MSNQFYNFYYDPVRQGYDSNTWSTISGAPSVVSNKLTLLNASIIHFSDILRGDATFNINIATPVAGDDVSFGFYDVNQLAGIGFRITDDELFADSFSGSELTSVAIDWASDWNNTNTSFQVRWEAGRVDFLINGIVRANISDDSVSGNPLNLYISTDSADSLKVNYINVKGVQSLTWS